MSASCPTSASPLNILLECREDLVPEVNVKTNNMTPNMGLLSFRFTKLQAHAMLPCHLFRVPNFVAAGSQAQNGVAKNGICLSLQVPERLQQTATSLDFTGTLHGTHRTSKLHCQLPSACRCKQKFSLCGDCPDIAIT